MTAARQQLERVLVEDADSNVDMLQRFARIDVANPPGDTREGARFLCDILERHGVAYRLVCPQESMPNIVAHVDGSGPGKHLVLNGHIDVFPVGERALWQRDPWSGEIADGRLHGRGVVDMKCGTMASLLTFLYLARLREHWSGRLTLTVVSDEETGGRWGSGYLVRELADEVLGDCVLNGEPSSVETVRFSEKAILWLHFTVCTPGSHGAYPHKSESATRLAAKLIGELDRIETLVPDTPPEVAAILAEPGVVAAIEAGLGQGASGIIQKATVNVGVLQGGVKQNMLPGDCRFEVDIRLPVGLTRHRVLEELAAILQRYPQATMSEVDTGAGDATWSDPGHEMLDLIQKNAAAGLGRVPQPIVNLGATDCRFWRAAGVPAFVYGPSPEGMGVPNESVAIAEYFHILRTHALSAYDYLVSGT